MFASSLSTTSVIAKIVHAGMNLTSNESQHIFGRFLVDAHDPARMAKVCELNSKAEPVGGAPALADKRHIVGRERVVTNNRRRIGRRIEQRRARLWREDFVLLHVGLLLCKRSVAQQVGPNVAQHHKSRACLSPNIMGDPPALPG